MKKYFIIFLTGSLVYGCGAAKTLATADKSPILVQMDLVNVVDDKVNVSVNPGAFALDDVAFYIPKKINDIKNFIR